MNNNQIKTKVENELLVAKSNLEYWENQITFLRCQLEKLNHVPQHLDVYRHKTDKNYRVLIVIDKKKYLVNLTKVGDWGICIGEYLDIFDMENWEFIGNRLTELPK